MSPPIAAEPPLTNRPNGPSLAEKLMLLADALALARIWVPFAPVWRKKLREPPMSLLVLALRSSTGCLSNPPWKSIVYRV